MHANAQSFLHIVSKSIINITWTDWGEIMYLRVEEGPQYRNGRSKGIDRLDRRMEDNDGRNDHGNPLHRVTNAKGQGRDLIEGHI